MKGGAIGTPLYERVFPVVTPFSRGPCKSSPLFKKGGLGGILDFNQWIWCLQSGIVCGCALARSEAQRKTAEVSCLEFGAYLEPGACDLGFLGFMDTA